MVQDKRLQKQAKASARELNKLFEKVEVLCVPLQRTLIRVAIDEDDDGETGGLVERLMGKKAELRYQYIQENARFAEDLDV